MQQNTNAAKDTNVPTTEEGVRPWSRRKRKARPLRSLKNIGGKRARRVKAKQRGTASRA